jgi:hypothetical protein
MKFNAGKEFTTNEHWSILKARALNLRHIMLLLPHINLSWHMGLRLG